MDFNPLWNSFIKSHVVNGQPGDSFGHRRGVQQGDLFSPMMFILAIAPLQRILDMATQQGILTPLPLTSMKIRTSLYADDAAIFATPKREDIQTIKTILEMFGKVTGLTTNFEKSCVHPIQW